MSVLSSAEGGLTALIEHFYGNECSAPARVLSIGVNHDQQMARIFALNCMQWSCPECNERLARKWQLDVMFGVSEYNQNDGLEFGLLTLTLSGRNRSRDSSVVAWREVYPKLNSRHYRKFGHCPSVTVPEPHRNGVIHLHSVTSSPASARWWKDNAYGCGAGYIADYEPVRDVGHCGAYVTKYLRKQNHVRTWPSGYNRVRATHGWPRLESPKGGSDYSFMRVKPEHLQAVVDRLHEAEYHVFVGWGGTTVDND